MKLIGRRNFVAGLGLGAGSTLLGPMARGLISDARGEVPTRKRLIFVTYGCGLIEESYTCAARSETDFDLSPSFAALEPLKKKTLILSKFYNPWPGGHGAEWASMSMVARQSLGNGRHMPGGISIDRLISNKLGAGDAVPFLGLSAGTYGGPPSSMCDGPGQVYPAETDPLKAYQRLFGQAAPAGEKPIDRLGEDSSVLDYVVGDISKLQTALGGSERQKLEQYLGSVRALERQLKVLAEVQGTCKNPMPPMLGPKGPSGDDSNFTEGRLLSFPKIIATAVGCGLTRFATFALSSGAGGGFYRFLGQKQGCHGIQHDQNMTEIRRIDGWVTALAAGIYQALQLVPEGNGTMADNSLVVLFNDSGGKHHDGASATTLW